MIREHCGMEDVVMKIEKEMLRWFAHTESANETRQPKKIFKAGVSRQVGKGQRRPSYHHLIEDVLRKDQLKSSAEGLTDRHM